ncbi:hypothetical protein C0708_24050 (plasmid) [Aeromonas caviae]|nr:hypothetical protein C0708_24050 [Aeromonas caviae]
MGTRAPVGALRAFLVALQVGRAASSARPPPAAATRSPLEIYPMGTSPLLGA